jgi:hypothetical protein
MKKGVFILLLGLALAAAAYGCVYLLGTSSARNLEQSSRPELSWLKQEFNLSDSDFEKVCALHQAYLPQCADMCRQIEAQNQRVRTLLAATNQMTAEIESAIAESARLRGQCQRNMLQHFYEVSRTMPPEEGRRYLEWVQERTLAGEGMTHHQ